MKRRFQATEQTTRKDLQRIMARIGASSLKTETDEPFDGKTNPTVTIRFVRNARMYRISKNSYPNALDNLRSIQQRLFHLWKAADPDDEFDISSDEFNKIFEQTFVGYLATPDEMILMLGDGSETWQTVLGLDSNATVEQIKNAYRAMSRQVHPDYGDQSNPADIAERTLAFQRLTKAYNTALTARGAK